LSENIETVLKYRGVPREFLKAEIKNKQAFEIPVNYSGYFLYGTVGSGKTWKAVAIMREMILRQSRPYKVDTMVRGIYDAWFYPVTSLLLKIKESFRDGAKETEGDIIDRISSHELVILDDMGTEKISDWTLQVMRTIIDTRSRENRMTIITSNFSLMDISDNMDDRIASRIKGMCEVIPVIGEDRRLSK
jgi:DNA replication protein DnaC